MICEHRTADETIYLKIYFTFICPSEPIAENREIRQRRFEVSQGLPVPTDNVYYPDDV